MAENKTLEVPPRAGPGSGTESWREFAEENDLEVHEDATRADIVKALEDSGVIESESDESDDAGEDEDTPTPVPESDEDAATLVQIKEELIEDFLAEGSMRLSGRMVAAAGSFIDPSLKDKVAENNEKTAKVLEERRKAYEAERK